MEEDVGLRHPGRVPLCAFTAVIANWTCCLFAIVGMDLLTIVCIGAALTSSGALPGVSQRFARRSPTLVLDPGGRALSLVAHGSSYDARGRRALARPTPDYVGIALLASMALAIVMSLALLGPGLASEVGHSIYCVDHAQEAVCS